MFQGEQGLPGAPGPDGPPGPMVSQNVPQGPPAEVAEGGNISDSNLKQMWSPAQDGNTEGLELTFSHGRTKTTVTRKQFPLKENQKSGEQLLHIR